MDERTGRPLFQPQINRASAAHKRFTADLSVGDYLYARRHDTSDRQRMLQLREHHNASCMRSASLVNSRSEAILTRLKNQRFHQIFDYLDEGCTGVVNLLTMVVGDSNRFSSGVLSKEIRKDVECAALLQCQAAGLPLAPVTPELFHDAEERSAVLVQAHANAACVDGVAVDAQGFARLMHSVVSQQRGVPRSYLLPDSRTRRQEAEPTFQPAINSKSMQLAQDRWHGAPGPVYQQLHDHAKSVEVQFCIVVSLWCQATVCLLVSPSLAYNKGVIAAAMRYLFGEVTVSSTLHLCSSCGA